ncbi:hypothetical protein SMSP2_01755 [Limihaloglobus sulfuriphilus]|uniref:Uncharacterized protein n=1 Tax=Limihaloglobus sulfuriphilus TaxID=1851148 RepID=A0A1Q2MGI4_9BACT|nr:hypothetical protein [Limihaloglobus sulfuriphilus]AQQ71382.1 hypothetical protein SMSP2_01755 [Limihaloglobus sulfuriphilus]
MALTRREHRILIVTIAVVALAVLNSYVLNPIFELRSAAAESAVEARAQLEDAFNILKREKLQRKRWQTMLQAGLCSDPEKTESYVVRFIDDCCRQNRMRVSSVQPQRLSPEEYLGEIEINVSASGSMSSVVDLLWDIETADIPVRLKSIQLGSIDESAETMSIQLSLSVIYFISRSSAQSPEAAFLDINDMPAENEYSISCTVEKAVLI